MTKKTLIIRIFVCILLLLVVTLMVFDYTLKIRKPWFDVLSDHQQAQTGSMLIWTKGWYRNGALNLRFSMMDNPESIEFNELLDRAPYTSYLPGALVPVHIINLLRQTEPTARSLMAYNLTQHFLIAYFLALLIFFFLKRLGFSCLNAFVLSVIPILAELLLPGPLYWHQNTFGFIQAAVLPYALYILLEVLRDSDFSRKTKRILNIFQVLVFWYGTFVNWTFFFVAISVYVKRIMEGSMEEGKDFVRRTLVFWMSYVAAVLCMVVHQLFFVRSFMGMIESFFLRTGISQGFDSTKFVHTFFEHFWMDHMVDSYGMVGSCLFMAGIVVMVGGITYLIYGRVKKLDVNKDIRSCVYLMCILIFPPILYVYTFRNWSVVHDMSTIIFSVPLATAVLVLVPVLIMLIVQNSLFGRKNRLGLLQGQNRNVWIFLVILIACSLYIIDVHPGYRKMFPKPNDAYKEIGEFLAENTNYNDIIFTPTFAPEFMDKQQFISYSMKRVYPMWSFNDVYEKVKDVEDKNYVVNVLFVNREFRGYRNGYGEINLGYDRIDNGVKELEKVSFDIREQNGVYLYKINRDVLLKMLGKSK